MLALGSCAGDSIFNEAPTASGSDVILPNPIALAYSTVTNKLYVLNSDGEVNYSTGSFARIDVDATNPNAPVLTAERVVSVEQFGADVVLDATFAYVTTRKSDIEGGAHDDHVYTLRIDDDSLDLDKTALVGPNPFGLLLDGTDLFVVSDRELNKLDAATLNEISTLDLNDLDDVSTKRVQGIAVDTVNDWLFVTNAHDDLLVIDRADDFSTVEAAVDYRVEGLGNTRGVAFADGRIYVIEGSPASLRTFDPTLLTKQATTQLIDESALGGTTAELGRDPGEMAIDVPNNRVYVTNTGDDTVSVFDLDLTPLATISVDEKNIDEGLADGNEPFGIETATVDGTPLVFVANYASDTLSIINATTLKVVATFPN